MDVTNLANLPIVIGITTTIKHCTLKSLLVFAIISFCHRLALLPQRFLTLWWKVINYSTILWPFIIKAQTDHIMGSAIILPSFVSLHIWINLISVISFLCSVNQFLESILDIVTHVIWCQISWFTFINLFNINWGLLWVNK